MQELRPDAKILEIAEKINHEVWKTHQTLNKGPIKLDHNDVRSSVQTALIILALEQVCNELRFANHKERMKALPNSMFSTGQLPINKGE